LTATAIWYPSASTATTFTANTTDWNFATSSISGNDTWHIRIILDTSIADDYGNCGGYIP